MSDPKDFYFSVRYNNTHDRAGVDQFFIVPKELFDDMGQDIFDTDPDECDIITFIKDTKLSRNVDVPFLYNKGYKACTQLVYEDLINLGVEENQDIAECFEHWVEDKYHSKFQDSENDDE